MFSEIFEYFTLAETQAARGAAATDALFAVFMSKESGLAAINLSTACRFSELIRLASKDLKKFCFLK